MCHEREKRVSLVGGWEVQIVIVIVSKCCVCVCVCVIVMMDQQLALSSFFLIEEGV